MKKTERINKSSIQKALKTRAFLIGKSVLPNILFRIGEIVFVKVERLPIVGKPLNPLANALSFPA